MKKIVVAIIFVCALAGATGVNARGCDGLAPKIAAAKPSNAKVAGVAAKLLALLTGGETATPDNVDCGSLLSALMSLVNGNPTGGRGLEPKAVLDRTAAQSELESALQKPAVQQALADIKQRVSDEDLRLLLEAAVFDDDGSYAARDLRLAQLRDRLGV